MTDNIDFILQVYLTYHYNEVRSHVSAGSICLDIFSRDANFFKQILRNSTNVSSCHICQPSDSILKQNDSRPSATAFPKHILFVFESRTSLQYWTLHDNGKITNQSSSSGAAKR